MADASSKETEIRHGALLTLGKIAISIVAAIFLIFHWLHRELVFDASTWGLIGIAVLPWVSGFLPELIDTARFAGLEIKFKHLKSKQETLQDQLETLKLLVNFVVTDDELKHLRKFASASIEPWPVDLRAPSNEFFEQELRRLRAMKLIEGLGLSSLFQHGGNVKERLKITKSGLKYLELRDRINAPTEG
jgi:hypothetical protein